MNSAEYDKIIFQLAETFLINQMTKNGQPITKEILSLQLQTASRPNNISGIYLRLLESSQNANMKAGVIGGSIGGVKNLGIILCDFQPELVLRKYGSDSDKVFADVKENLMPRGKLNPNGLWAKYCQTILASAKFLSQFNSLEEFYVWVDWFYEDDRARPALPLLLQQQINGFGLALACDFLKEIGYIKYGKPDVHLRKIFVALKLCHEKANDFELLEAINRLSKNAEVTPFHADKIFWLIGSGLFSNKMRIGRKAEDFIQYVKDNINK